MASPSRDKILRRADKVMLTNCWNKLTNKLTKVQLLTESGGLIFSDVDWLINPISGLKADAKIDSKIISKILQSSAWSG